MAASILSFGMLTARAFWMVRRSVGLEAGSEPPDFTAMVMSLAMRANCFAMRFQRANIVCLRTSKMRPTQAWCPNGRGVRQRRAARGAGCLRELCLQQAHAAQLQRETALDVAQAALQVSLLLDQPLLLEARPVGERREEILVLLREACPQLLDVRVARQPGETQLHARELHGEQRAL